MNSKTLGRRIRIKIRAQRFKNKTTAPYLSGDCFARLADQVFTSVDQVANFGSSPPNSRGRIFFIQSELLDDALNSVTFRDHCKVLICGNSDFNFNKAPDIPEKTRLILLQNSTISDNERIFTLPIGVENAKLGRYNFEKYLQPLNSERIHDRVLVPPMSPTNPVRAAVRDQVRSMSSIFDLKVDYLHEKEYFNLTRKFRFLLSLPGNGIEDHRIWETLYQGNFPVVLRSPWSDSLDVLNLPILVVESLKELTLDLLLQHHDEYSGFEPRQIPALWMPYWESKILTALAMAN